MEAVAHNPSFAKRVGISQEVGREFVAADKSSKSHTPTRNPANRMDIALFKGGDGSMFMSHDAMHEAMKHAEKAGRKGDTELVHINKHEEEMLKAAGGSGTTNPRTGLKEYYEPEGASLSDKGRSDSSADKAGRSGASAGGGGGAGGGHFASGAGFSGTNQQTAATASKSFHDTVQANIDRDTAAGKYDKSGYGKVIGGMLGSASPLGPIGGIIGGMIGDAIDSALSGPPTVADVQAEFLGGSGFGGPGKVGKQGGGNKGSKDTTGGPQSGASVVSQNTGSGPVDAVTPPSTTPASGPQQTKDYIDLLLDRFKFPYFAQPAAQQPDTGAHAALIQSVLGQYQGS